MWALRPRRGNLRRDVLLSLYATQRGGPGVVQMKVRSIEWSEEREANPEVSYNHVVGTTPFGRFLLTWKGWKEPHQQDVCVDETPWNNEPVTPWTCDLDEAKALCQFTFEEKVLACVESDGGGS